MIVNGQKLTAVMQGKGLTAEDLEKLTGYDCGWIADLMEDQVWAAMPTSRQVAKIAKAIGVDLSTFAVMAE